MTVGDERGLAMQVEYLVNLAAAQADATLAEAFGRAAQPAPFDRLAWWQALAEDCLADERPLLAVVRNGQGVLALPMMQQPGSRQLRSLACWYSFWARPVLAGTSDREGLIEALARDLPHRCPRVSLGPLAEADAAAVARGFSAAGWRVLESTADTNHRLELAGRDFAAYWASRPGQLRETVRRKRAKGQVEVQIADGFDRSRWAAYESVYARSWKPAEGSPAFLRRFAEAEGVSGTLRLGLASIGGRPVAAQLWTVENGIAYIHKLAHDESAQAFSPGTLLTAALFEHAINRDGVAWIDFGTGDEPYKRDWMETARPMLRLDMHWPRSPSSWPHLIRARARSLVSAPQHG